MRMTDQSENYSPPVEHKVPHTEMSIKERFIRFAVYATSPGLGERSELSQDIGRNFDRFIGKITGNPCRGCDIYYEYTHGRPRWVKGHVILVESPESNDEDLFRPMVVDDCRRRKASSITFQERKAQCAEELADAIED